MIWPSNRIESVAKWVEAVREHGTVWMRNASVDEGGSVHFCGGISVRVWTMQMEEKSIHGLVRHCINSQHISCSLSSGGIETGWRWSALCPNLSICRSRVDTSMKRLSTKLRRWRISFVTAFLTGHGRFYVIVQWVGHIEDAAQTCGFMSTCWRRRLRCQMFSDYNEAVVQSIWRANEWSLWKGLVGWLVSYIVVNWMYPVSLM